MAVILVIVVVVAVVAIVVVLVVVVVVAVVSVSLSWQIDKQSDKLLLRPHYGTMAHCGAL